MNYKEEILKYKIDIRKVVFSKLYKFNKEDKEDVINNIILKLLESENKYDPLRGHIKKYIIKSTYNYINTYLKKNYKINELTNVSSYIYYNNIYNNTPYDDLLAKQDEDVMNLDSFTSEEKKVIQAIQVLGTKRAKKIAEYVGISPRKVYYILGRLKNG